ncbi:hypothetical protein HKB47_26355 [Mesorhizobium japonicum]|uniref:Uncharacterized protein n=2 Tax=Mesorhizobium TaxID=68287 RepID=A0A1A5JG26_RHILI|nr:MULTISPECIES: hypothetical protein [Mesorhizobium]MBE1708444.1 hypothetical protein [Mesorhizobium japonicum]MBE1713613.1 hypothetical protein [Mesorhizobium japonicum]MUT19762.1 hypothetical protein [Mesorhizobium japonicum]MUT25732.1 hypothetical protein [Mesorhizobium japonicum]OBP71235.1 hypothetical protein BAE42_18505 [Mesorhizobium loti]
MPTRRISYLLPLQVEVFARDQRHSMAGKGAQSGPPAALQHGSSLYAIGSTTCRDPEALSALSTWMADVFGSYFSGQITRKRVRLFTEFVSRRLAAYAPVLAGLSLLRD